MKKHFALLLVLAASGLGAAHAGTPINNQYIVVLEPGAQLQSGSVARTAQSLLGSVGGGDVLQTYDRALTGFAARLPAVRARRLARQPGVAYVEQDQTMHLTGVQFDPSWGLDRIDQRELPLDGMYEFPDDAGAGVNVYIIDTGLRSAHVDFAGRVGQGQNFAGDGGLLGNLLCQLLGLLCPEVDPEDTEDCNGHGTHVAGTASGTEFGVSKQATVIPVRVFGCGNTTATSTIIAGVDWVTANAELPAVANLSLGGGVSQALDNALLGMINAGVTAVVAAGNDNANACNSSPARVEEAITVASTDNTDIRSSFSNFGECVDIFAPGRAILSAWHTGDTAANTISGTSMASPHVAGGAARYLTVNPGASPAEVMDFLLDTATPDVVANPGNGSPNLLLYLDPAGP